MDDQTQQNITGTVQVVVQTAEAMAPAIAAVNPKAAVVVALVPDAIKLLQQAADMQKAGVIEPDALAALFASVGAGIKASHDKWAALNAQ